MMCIADVSEPWNQPTTYLLGLSGVSKQHPKHGLI